ncbi:MAG: IPT/TIG domain-containing protein, partial [Planctomycetes bacterium]|nr:IPT/TIG domain-containing protein [Planctomycetota bacterium]
PTIGGFAPTAAGANNTVTITGTNLSGATSVTFGGGPIAAITTNTATQITATVPAGSASGSVVVINPGGTATSPGFTFIAAPTIGGFAPPAAGANTTVTITGTNLSSATSVTFGGGPIAAITSNSPTQILATVPAGSASGSVAVITSGGTATSPGFTFIPAPTITLFAPTVAAIGSTVTITGTNLSNASSVTFGAGPIAAITTNTATQITATVPAGSTTGSVVVINPGGTATSPGFALPAPDSLEFFVQPSGGIAGAPNSAFQVRILDNLGNLAPLTTGTVTLAFVNNPTLATLNGTIVAVTSGGVATFNNVVINTSGAGYTLGATTAGLTSATSAGFNITHAAPSQLAFTTSPLNGTAGVAQGVVVEVRDAFSNVATLDSGTLINYGIGLNPGGSSLSGVTSGSTIAGIATGSLSFDKVGVGYTLTASTAGLTTATTTTFDIQAAGPDRLTFVQQPSNSSAGIPIAPAITVRLDDAFGNQTSSAAVISLSILNNPGGAILGGTAGQPATAGLATFGDLTLDRPGVGYTLSATSAAVGTATISLAFNNVAGPAANLAIVQQPAPNIPVIAPITTAVIVAVTDAGGNVVLADNGRSITVAIGNNPGAATLSGTTAQVNSAGLAVFPDLSLDNPGVGYTLSFSSVGLVSTATTAFNANLRRLVFIVQPTNSDAVTPLAPTVTVAFQDTLGNPLNTTDPISVALVSSGTLSGTTNAAAIAGVTSFGGLQVQTTGAQQLTATAASSAPQLSNVFTITAGPPTQLAFTSQPSTIVVNAGLPAVVVELRDALGNVAPVSTTVTVSLLNGSGLSGTLGQLSAGGVATFPDLNVSQVGNGRQLSASVAGITSLNSTSFNILAPAPTIVSVTPTSSSADGSNGQGGQTFVEIKGTNFFLPMTAMIGGSELRNLAVIASDTITGDLAGGPALPGQADVVVANAAGSDVLVNGFTFLSSWIPCNTGMTGGTFFGVSRLTSSATTLFLGGQKSGVFKSTDAGTTWTRTKNGPVGIGGITFDPADASVGYASVASNTSNLVFQTLDGAQTWRAIGAVGDGSKEISSVVVDPTDSSVIYVTTGERQPGFGLFKSVDGGASFAAIGTGTLPGDMTTRGGALAIDPTNTQILFVAHTTGNQGLPTASQGLYTSTDGGATWSAVGTAVFDFIHSIAIDPQNTQIIYLGIRGTGVYKSTDGGATFSAINTNLGADLEVESVVIHPTTGVLYTSLRDSGVYRSNDAGATWTLKSTGLTDLSNGLTTDIAEVLRLTLGPGNEVWVGSFGQGVFRSTDNGDNWAQINTGLEGVLNVMNVLHDPVSSGRIIAATQGRGILRSLDGGSSWQTRNTNLQDLHVFNKRSVAMDPQNPQVLWFATEDSGIFRSLDDGGNWTNTQSLPIPALAQHSAIAAVGSTVYVASDANLVHVSLDGGGTWALANTNLPAGSGITALVINRDNANVAYATFGGFNPGMGIWKTVNGGTTWTQLVNGPLLANGQVSDLIQDPVFANRLYASVNGIQPLVSDDAGATWAALNSTLTSGFSAAVTVPASNPLKIYATQGNDVDSSNDGGANWNNTFGSGLPQGPAGLAVDNLQEDVVFACFGFGGSGVWKTNTGGASVADVISITSISTATDPTDDNTGQVMTLSGTGFTSNTQVFVGGVPAAILSITPTSITFMTPNGQPAGIYDISVNSPNGNSVLVGALGIGTGVSVVSPNIATSSGRNPLVGSTQFPPIRIEVHGLNLTGPVGISIGGRSLSNVALVDSTTIAGDMEAQPGELTWIQPGVYHVTVSHGLGTHTLFNAFTVADTYITTHANMQGGGGSGAQIVADQTTPNVAYYLTQGDLYRSLDAGNNWSRLSTPTDFLTFSVAATTGTLYASGTQNECFKSTDKGVTWAQVGVVGAVSVLRLTVDQPTTRSFTRALGLS